MSENIKRLEELTLLWRTHKLHEQEASDARRKVEDEITALMGFAADETGNRKIPGGLVVRLSTTEKVDSESLRALAMMHGLLDWLPKAFRWKPEIEKREWDKMPIEAKLKLAPAITKKPARPGFSFTPTEEE